MTKRHASLVKDTKTLNSKWSTALPFIRSANDLAEWATIAFILTFVLLIFVFLPRGLDFSDTGFYYVSIFNLQEIDMQTSQFSVVWHFFSFIESILFHRVLTLVLMFFAALYCLRSAQRFVNPELRSSWLSRGRIAALASLIIIPFYAAWAPDPSYNSLGFTLVLVIFGLGFQVTRKLSNDGELCRIDLTIAGFLITPLFLARPFAPAVTGLVIIGLIMMFAKPSIIKLVISLAFVLVGVALYLILQGVFVEPIWVSLERMEGGFVRRDLLARGDILNQGYEHAKYQAELIIRNNKLLIALAATNIFLLVIHPAHMNDSIRKFYTGIATISLVLAFVIIGLRSDLMSSFLETRETQLDLSSASFILYSGGTIALIVLIPTGIIFKRSQPETTKNVAVLLSGLMIAVATFFGTSNGWIYNLDRYAGIFVASIILVSVMYRRHKSSFISTSLFLFSGLFSLLHLKNMVYFPYRLPMPLTAQTAPVTSLRGLTYMRVDVPTKQLLEDLARAQQPLAALPEAPVLIDLSGRLPMTAFLLNVSTPRSAWVLSGYNGSQALFDYTYRDLEYCTLQSAWILESPGWAHSFDPSTLTERGLKFPEDYSLVLQSWSPYIKSELKLWAPNFASINDFKSCFQHTLN